MGSIGYHMQLVSEHPLLAVRVLDLRAVADAPACLGIRRLRGLLWLRTTEASIATTLPKSGSRS